jgi:hypothetical protein
MNWETLKLRLEILWNIRWLRRSLIGLFILLAILLIIPVTIQFTLIHQLEKMGAQQASIEDIDLNPFSGRFELTQLSFSSQGQQPARLDHLLVDLDILALFSGRVVVDEVSLKGVKLDVSKADDEQISINGLPLPVTKASNEPEPKAENSSAEPLKFGLNVLKFDQIDITYQETDFSREALINHLELDNLKSWETDSTAELGLDMQLNERPITLNAELQLFKQKPLIKGQLTADGLSTENYKKFYVAYLDKLSAKIQLNTQFEIEILEDKSINAQISKKLHIHDLDATYKNLNQRAKLIEWESNTTIQPNERLNSGRLLIQKSETRDISQNYLLASFDALELSDLKLDQQNLDIGKLKLDKLNFVTLKQQDSFVQLEQLLLQQLKLAFAESKLEIADISLKQPKANVTITEEKQVASLQPLLTTLAGLTSSQDAASETPQTEDEAKPFTIIIGKLALVAPGLVHFTDNSVSPKYQTDIALERIDITNISSVEPASFDLGIKQGEYTLIDVKGDGLLMDPVSQLELSANIKQLDLPPITPYTSETMGYGMKSGVIDSDIKLSLKQKEIDSVVDLKIDSIEVVETNQKTAEQVSSASGMSIDLAVSTLKDSDNIINLKLPIKGNIDEPDFDLSQIINKAMGQAMKSASLTYLKHALQPFGSLITLFSLAKAAADHISLPPILFEANSLEFKPEQQDLLNKVLKVLKERPGLKIKACAISALEDQEAIRAQLIEEEKARLKKADKKVDKIVIEDAAVQQLMKQLADQRSAKVKAFFIEQGKLDSSRILNCLSATSTEKDAKPSVEMQI